MNFKSIGLSIVASTLAASVAFASSQDKTHLEYRLVELQKQVDELKSELVSHQDADVSKVVKKKNAKSKIARSKNAKEKAADKSVYKELGSLVTIDNYTDEETYHKGNSLLIKSPGVLAPGILLDQAVLAKRQADDAALTKAGLSLPSQPRLLLSGKLEADAIYDDQYRGKSTTDLNLSAAELDILATVNPWTSGFMAITYDNSMTNTSNASARRLDNSRMRLDKGFITLGNLDKSPFYGSFGQMYVPFSRYDSWMISDPLTKFVGKTKARAITATYLRQSGNLRPYVEGFWFKGDASYANDGNASQAKQGGADTGIVFKRDKLTADLGVSYISSIADSDGLQGTGASSGFKGFNENSDKEKLVHAVGGAAAHGNVGYGNFYFNGEYITALQEFSQSDLTYNNGGAQPKAWNTEAAYLFHLFNRSSSIALGYSRSYEALGLNIPEQRYMLTMAMTLLSNLTAYLELRHDINYGNDNTATGRGTTAYIKDNLGRNDNAITFRLGMYF